MVELVSRNLEMDESIVECFFEESIPALEELATLLRRDTKEQTKLRGSLDYIGRAIHKIKGDAAMLKFDEAVELLHEFEDGFTPLHNKTRLSKSDFVEFIPKIKKIIYSLQKAKTTQKYVDAGNVKKIDASVDLFFQYLQSYTNKITKENKKNIRIVNKGFTHADIPTRLRKNVLSMVVQLLRNAVIHGIEDKENRISAKKRSYGSIHIGLQKHVGSFTITVWDDGAGLDFTKIKQVAIKSGRYNQAQIENCTRDQLLKFIFQPGFSTAKKVDQHAGRGIGLDLVNTTVKDLGGKLSIRTRQGIFTGIAMTFPSEMRNRC